MARADYTIIGGGIAGLTTALLLAERGYRVRVYEERYPGAGATGAAAGLLVLHLKPQLIEIALDSLSIYKRIAGKGYIFNMGALLFTTPSCARGYEEAMRSHGLAAYRVDEERAREIAGLPLRTMEGEEVLYVDEYLVDVGSLVSRLHSLLGEAGATIEHAPGSIEAEGETIIAAGAWSHLLAPELQDKLILYRCQAAAYEAPRPGPALEDDTHGYYAVTHPGGDLVAGDGANTIITRPEEGYTPDQWEPYEILERISKRIPGAEEGYPRRIWSAPCSTTPDSLPLAGTLREGIHVITGFNGLGITLAGGVAARLVDYLEGKTRSMGMLDPARPMPPPPPDRPPEPYDECPPHSNT
ncbi:MAG: FAD-binding oxidoreductase [Desulfurococcales archaeon]|nr:FAD-binding oxidoreductase [Desulfurococcales archaeon]